LNSSADEEASDEQKCITVIAEVHHESDWDPEKPQKSKTTQQILGLRRFENIDDISQAKSELPLYGSSTTIRKENHFEAIDENNNKKVLIETHFPSMNFENVEDDDMKEFAETIEALNFSLSEIKQTGSTKPQRFIDERSSTPLKRDGPQPSELEMSSIFDSTHIKSNLKSSSELMEIPKHTRLIPLTFWMLNQVVQQICKNTQKLSTANVKFNCKL
jgi:hypothetical protein